jgi:hypothetical protein
MLFDIARIFFDQIDGRGLIIEFNQIVGRYRVLLKLPITPADFVLFPVKGPALSRESGAFCCPVGMAGELAGLKRPAVHLGRRRKRALSSACRV